MNFRMFYYNDEVVYIMSTVLLEFKIINFESSTSSSSAFQISFGFNLGSLGHMGFFGWEGPFRKKDLREFSVSPKVFTVFIFHINCDEGEVRVKLV